MHRRGLGVPALSPSGFVLNQAMLSKEIPDSSAIGYVNHSFIVKKLQACALTKPIGFRRLLISDDVLGLLGMQDEPRLRFDQYPMEHGSHLPLEVKQRVHKEIILALKGHGLYKSIMNGQLYS